MKMAFLAIIERLSNEMGEGRLTLNAEQGRIRARLFNMGVIQSEDYSENGDVILNIRMSKSDFERLSSQEGLSDHCFCPVD